MSRYRGPIIWQIFLMKKDDFARKYSPQWLKDKQNIISQRNLESINEVVDLLRDNGNVYLEDLENKDTLKVKSMKRAVKILVRQGIMSEPTEVQPGLLIYDLFIDSRE